MARKLILLVLPFAGLLAGCGEKADQKDFIDAPMVNSSQSNSMKARGMTDAQIAAHRDGPAGAGR